MTCFGSNCWWTKCIEMLRQLIHGSAHSLQGFIYPRPCRISFINSTWIYCRPWLWKQLKLPWVWRDMRCKNVAFPFFSESKFWESRSRFEILCPFSRPLWKVLVGDLWHMPVSGQMIASPVPSHWLFLSRWYTLIIFVYFLLWFWHPCWLPSVEAYACHQHQHSLQHSYPDFC